MLSGCQKAPSTRRCIKTRKRRNHDECPFWVRKHPAPEGALRLPKAPANAPTLLSQKAPSTRRCIKTQSQQDVPDELLLVRKHPAPEGALRLVAFAHDCEGWFFVRKHPAPEGASRLVSAPSRSRSICCQKAPSTRRCIKTSPVTLTQSTLSASESAQHQKVH